MEKNYTTKVFNFNLNPLNQWSKSMKLIKIQQRNHPSIKWELEAFKGITQSLNKINPNFQTWQNAHYKGWVLSGTVEYRKSRP